MENKLLVLVSGGRSSATMARIIQTSPKYDKYEKLYVFCNTGQERRETIQFLKNIVHYWGIPLNIVEGLYSAKKGVGVKSKIVSFDTMSRNSEPFTGAIMQLNKNKWTGVPNQGTPYCSEYLKVRPSHHYAKIIFGTTKYLKAIGYRKEDMPKRITPKELEIRKDEVISPLITDFDTPVGNLWLNKWWENKPFKLELHNKYGNCEMCWKKDEPILIQNIQYGINSANWYRGMEALYGDAFFRKNKSIDDLIKEAESSIQTSLFPDNYNGYSGDGCVCKF